MQIREALPSDTAAIAKVKVDTWRHDYVGIVPDERLASLSYEEVQACWLEGLSGSRAGTFYYVAQADDGEIVGYACGGPERTGDPDHAGELYAIYVRPEFQRRGIGLRLFRTVARRLGREGLGSMLLWVLAKNPQRGFYEALGGRPLRTKTVTIGGAVLDEVAYGWHNVEAIAGGTDAGDRGRWVIDSEGSCS